MSLATHTVETAKSVTSHEFTATMPDGTELFYRCWEPEVEPPTGRRAVILFHRGHEHSARLSELAFFLVAQGLTVFAWDQRGHGHSPGERGYASSFGTIIKDADAFARHICDRHDLAIEDIAVVGHSVGAVIAAAWVHDYAPRIRSMVLVTPALRIKLYVPLAIPGLRLLNRIKQPAFIKSYVRSSMLTHDAEQAAAYDADPLISRNISVNILLGLHDTSTRLIDDAAAIRTPTLIIGAGSDWVVSLPAQKKFFDRLGSPVKRMETHDSFHHSVLHERGREKALAQITDFVRESFAAAAARPTNAITANPGTPPSPGPLDKLNFAIARIALRTAGRLSKGISLGWNSGFDSGRSLDHIYRNRAEGTTPVGRLFDRLYLDTPGWNGIRARKKNMETLLERAIREFHANHSEVTILDIAAGPGRYVMDTMLRLRDIPIRAVLRDRDEKGLAEGREIARSASLSTVTHESGDAFDPASLATVEPRPSIAIASGLYELFHDNDMVLRSLRGLHAITRDNGLLLYTNQPWHPQLAFIANVLTNREGKPWVMRCRSQAEMDALIAAAGFEKIAMETDEQAIFTVSLARKLPKA